MPVVTSLLVVEMAAERSWSWAFFFAQSYEIGIKDRVTKNGIGSVFTFGGYTYCSVQLQTKWL